MYPNQSKGPRTRLSSSCLGHQEDEALVRLGSPQGLSLFSVDMLSFPLNANLTLSWAEPSYPRPFDARDLPHTLAKQTLCEETPKETGADKQSCARTQTRAHTALSSPRGWLTRLHSAPCHSGKSDVTRNWHFGRWKSKFSWQSSTQILIYTYTYTHMYTYEYTYTYVHSYGYVCVCICVYIYILVI